MLLKDELNTMRNVELVDIQMIGEMTDVIVLEIQVGRRLTEIEKG